MMIKKAELLVFMKIAGSISAADEALLDLIHPLAEASVFSFLQQNLEYQLTTEYLPLGKPVLMDDTSLRDVDFRERTATVISGNVGTSFLQLRNTPVYRAGLRVHEDIGAYAGSKSDPFNSETLLTEGDDYYLDVDDPTNDLSRTGILYRIGAWPAEPRSVKVEYYGGWTASQLSGPLAGDLKLAMMQTISSAFFNGKQISETSGQGLKMSESIGSKYSYSLGQTGHQVAVANLTFAVPIEAQRILFRYRQLGNIFG
jgi:hypothetical protein